MGKNIQHITATEIYSKAKRTHIYANPSDGWGWIDGEGNYWQYPETTTVSTMDDIPLSSDIVQYINSSNGETLSEIEYDKLSDTDKLKYTAKRLTAASSDIYNVSDERNKQGDTKFIIDAMDIEWAPYEIGNHKLRTTTDLMNYISQMIIGKVRQRNFTNGNPYYLLTTYTPNTPDGYLDRTGFSTSAYVFNYVPLLSSGEFVTYTWSDRYVTDQYDLGVDGEAFWSTDNNFEIPTSSPAEKSTDAPETKIIPYVYTPENEVDIIPTNEIWIKSTSGVTIKNANAILDVDGNVNTLTGTYEDSGTTTIDGITSSGWTRFVFAKDIYKLADESIYYGVFDLTSSLTQIILPNKITEIGDYSFHECTRLSTVIFPAELQRIGDVAFQSDNIYTLNLPDTLTVIGGGKQNGYVFQRNKYMSALTLPKHICYIGGGSFWGCYSMTKLTIQSSSLQKLYGGCFRGCTALATITIYDNGEHLDSNYTDIICTNAFENAPTNGTLTITRSKKAQAGGSIYGEGLRAVLPETWDYIVKYE